MALLRTLWLWSRSSREHLGNPSQVASIYRNYCDAHHLRNCGFALKDCSFESFEATSSGDDSSPLEVFHRSDQLECFSGYHLPGSGFWESKLKILPNDIWILKQEKRYPMDIIHGNSEKTSSWELHRRESPEKRGGFWTPGSEMGLNFRLRRLDEVLKLEHLSRLNITKFQSLWYKVRQDSVRETWKIC